MLSNQIECSGRVFFLSSVFTEYQIYEPAYDGNDGNYVPDEFGFC